MIDSSIHVFWKAVHCCLGVLFSPCASRSARYKAADASQNDLHVIFCNTGHCRIKPDDERAFAIQFEMHSTNVYGFCLHITSNQSEADELLESVFWNFWRDGVLIWPDAETLDVALVKSALRIRLVELRQCGRQAKFRAVLAQLRLTRKAASGPAAEPASNGEHVLMPHINFLDAQDK